MLELQKAVSETLLKVTSATVAQEQEGRKAIKAQLEDVRAQLEKEKVAREAVESKLKDALVESGLLLRHLNEVTILGKPYYLPYIPIMVT